MRWRWTCRDYTRWIEMWARGLMVRYGYKEWGNVGCFGNPIVVSGSVLCNILYCIVKSFSLIRGRRHGWPNHVKTSCTVCVIVLSLCSWTNIVGIKAFVGTTTEDTLKWPKIKLTQIVLLKVNKWLYNKKLLV